MLLGAYFVLLVGISFATNSRSTFADAVPTIGICVLLAKGLGRIDMRRRGAVTRRARGRNAGRDHGR